ncbi:MAG: SGNH/GDSL hydrolase family protein [Candidatus Omnitrophica bacterium]|nr:SGNH/GDSL hydrolase family protein [Candidatus Omnitrophota bacterium]
MKHKGWANLLLLIGTLLLLFLGIELVLRKTHWLEARLSWAIPDPLLGWHLASGENYVFLRGENDNPIPFRINRHGWRGKDWSIDKDPSTYRVAVLGDSYVESLQIEEESTFLALTESSLRQETGRSVEFLNFGRSCTTQIEEYLILEREILKFKPDAVVLFFYAVNDIGDMHPSTALSLMRPFYEVDPHSGTLKLDTRFKDTWEYKIKSWINPLKRKSYFISLLSERFIIFERLKQIKNMGFEDSEPDPERGLEGYLSLATATPDLQYEKNFALSKRLIREMSLLCRKHGIPFLLVNIDTPDYFPKNETRFKSLDPTFRTYFFDDDLAAFAEAEGITLLGLTQPFRETFEKESKILHFDQTQERTSRHYWEYGSHSGHWNYEGHRLTSRLLTEKLKLMIQNAAVRNASLD